MPQIFLDLQWVNTEIAAHPGISNWQVQQARNALELYYEKFRGIALSPRNCLPTDDFAVSVHSTHEPVLKTRPPNALTQKDNPTTKAVYTRPFGDVNTKVDEKHNEKHNAMPGPIRGLDGATGDDTQVAQH